LQFSFQAASLEAFRYTLIIYKYRHLSFNAVNTFQKDTMLHSNPFTTIIHVTTGYVAKPKSFLGKEMYVNIHQ
jgi:hypothetical protein